MARDGRWIGWVLASGAVLALGAAAADAAPPEKAQEQDREVRVIVVEGDEPDGGRVRIVCKDGDCDTNAGRRAFLGVHVEDSPEGTRIVGLVEDSPAAKAGLQEGDIVVALDDKPVRGPASLTARLREYEPGSEVTVEVLREGKPERVKVTLGERPKRWSGRPFIFEWDPLEFEREWRETLENSRESLENLRQNLRHMDFLRGWGKPRLGVQLVEPTPELREHFGGAPDAGVLVSKVLPGTPAERSGIRVGDLIVAAGGERVEDARDLIDAVAKAEGETIRIELIRDRKSLSVDVAIPRDEEPEEERPRGPRA